MNDTDQQAPPPPPPPPPAGPPPPPPSSSGGPAPGWHDNGHWRSEHLSDYRLLRRSHDDKKVAGVAGGVARHLDVDPTIVRVLFVVSIFFGGAGLLVYAVLWLVVPDDTTGRSALSVRDATRNVIVISVLVLGVILALGDTFDGGSISWPPLVVIAVVTLVWLMARDRREERRSGPDTATPSTAGSGTGAPGWSGATYTPAPAAPRAPRRRRRGPLLFGATLALGALALGVLGLVEASGVTVVDGAYPALALTVVGLMLVLGSVYGRPGGLVLLGIASCLALAAVSVTQPRFDGDRDLTVAPTSAEELDSAYTVPAGRIAVDLTDVDDLGALDGRRLDLSANAGEILVTVPEGLTVELDADVAYGGAVDWPDGTRGGWGFGLDRRFGDADDPTITIDADLDFGHIELRQP
ncbi:PspC domain-containing protein [Nocardioides sp. HDW12B]|uniref:PspC domain-containing protein n=1 Tax=Nocardioides sp. HDW12B TaxID=2714939 RepID=UPI00140A4E67|nr:PspC domain-containing protein [Nocardioides sp. HDW12B]QIK65462.1 PspC domain-containing protein [Nocardioides sp. HDW12B]